MTTSGSGSGSGSKADEPMIIERNRTRQYARYEDKINEQPVIRLKPSSNKFIRESTGESKAVYKGFDSVLGKHIAWSKTVLTSQNHEILYKQAKLLHSFDHKNIIKCYDCWVDFDDQYVTLNMITEFYDGNLRDYSKKHWIDKFQETSTIIHWCRHILQGLIYLHNLSPPIFLGSLYLEDLFVVGNSGTIKVGDLCSAIVLEPEGGTSNDADADAVAKARSEIYEFGMCVLQMMSRDNLQRRWRDSHDRLKRVSDEELKEFIQKCIGGVDVRPTAIELLNDPFLEPGFEDLGLYLTGCVLPDLRQSSIVEFPSSDSSDQRLRPVKQSERRVEKVITDCKGEKRFGLIGEVKDRELIHMNFMMYNGRRVMFYMSNETDMIPEVVKKIEEEFKLSDEDAALVFQIMDEVITELRTEKSETVSKIDSNNTSSVISENASSVSEIDSKTSAVISENALSVSKIGSKTSAVISENASSVSEGVQQTHETTSSVQQHQVRGSSGSSQARQGAKKKQEWQVVTRKKKKNRQHGGASN